MHVEYPVEILSGKSDMRVWSLEERSGGICLGDTVVFKAMSLDEIFKGVRAEIREPRAPPRRRTQ